MWRLKGLATETDYREHLDIAFPAGSEVSETEKDLIQEFYAAYVRGLGRPTVYLKGLSTRTGLLDAVHDAYSLVQQGKSLSTLRAELKILAEKCPYCGIGEIQDLDHLLQRGQYKLFSIFALNLVPCCATCNRGKRKKPSQQSEQHQVHVYLEDVSAHDFFRADVQIDAATGALLTRFYIERSPGMASDVYDRLCHHIDEFDLQERYIREANIHLGGQVAAFEMAFEAGGAEALQALLTKTAAAHARRFGSNDWRTALMRGAASCEAFCEGGFRQALGRDEASL